MEILERGGERGETTFFQQGTQADLAVVVGVASPAFGGLTFDDPDLWIPVTRHPHFVSGSRLLTSFADDEGVRMWGRMRPGHTPAAVEAELASLLLTLRDAHPASSAMPRYVSKFFLMPEPACTA